MELQINLLHLNFFLLMYDHIIIIKNQFDILMNAC
jgi:hypothetical protein